MEVTVSNLVELKSPLHDVLRQFLSDRPDWDSDRVFNCAIALFLLQGMEGEASRDAAAVYLEEMFKRGVGDE